MLQIRSLAALCVGVLCLSACGTLTGIPSHGGGKRFAIEQELVAASARAAIKQMDLSALQGKKVALYISTMGDQGAGNISGGRYSLDALIRGEYLNTPSNITDYSYPNHTTDANTSAGLINSTTISKSVLMHLVGLLHTARVTVLKGVLVLPHKDLVIIAAKL